MRLEGVRGRLAVAATLVATAALTVTLTACDLQVKNGGNDLVAGKKLFVERCGACHVMARAGTKGTSGPNLDQAFQRSIHDGFKRDTIEGVTRAQIADPNPRGVQVGPERPGKDAPRLVMPANLVEGTEAADVAAYVAYAAARPGKDTGRLAEAVPMAGGGRPIAAANGLLQIDADPNGQLAYVSRVATAPPGDLQIQSRNASSVPHDIAIEGPGVPETKGEVVSGGGISRLPRRIDFRPGRYAYFCTVPGHRAAGMEGTLTVK